MVIPQLVIHKMVIQNMALMLFSIHVGQNSFEVDSYVIHQLYCWSGKVRKESLVFYGRRWVFFSEELIVGWRHSLKDSLVETKGNEAHDNQVCQDMQSKNTRDDHHLSVVMI